MFTSISRISIAVIALASVARAATITLENTIPSGNLFTQPPVLTGAATVFGTGGGVVVANGFTVPVSASLDRISVVVEYISLFDVTGRSPMLLTLFTDNGNSPGAVIESWTVPVDPLDTSLTIITVNSIAHSLLQAGRQYWLSEVPADPVHTGIGWGLALPGVQLPVTGNDLGVNGTWSPAHLGLANEFSVTGTTVPEPATFGISALFFLSIMARLQISRHR